MLVTFYNWILPLLSLLGAFWTKSPNNGTEVAAPGAFPTDIPEIMTMTTLAMDDDDFVPEAEKRSILAKAVGCLAFTFLGVSGIVGNALVIYTIFTDPAVQVKTQLSNLPILNLAYTDLMTTSMVCVPGAIFIVFDEYNGGRIFCLIWSMANLTGFITTMGLLAVISVDRFIAVTWSLHYPTWVTYNRLMAACVWEWSSCFICVIGWTLTKFDYDFWGGVCDITWIALGPDSGGAFIYGIGCTSWYFVTPSAVILGANLLIIQNSKEKGRVGKLEGGKQQKAESKTNSKVLKAMIIVIASYFILTFPSGVVKVTKVLGGPKGPAKYIPGWVTTSTSLLQLSASIVNPLIYGLFRKDFRESYARTWKRIRGQ